MSKQMDRATMTAYQRARRAKKKVAALAAVNPSCQSHVKPVVKPAAAPCPGCEQLRAEVSRIASALATMVDKQQTDRQAAQPTNSPQHSGRPTEKMTDSDALRQHVISEKINSYGKNPVIGRARI